MNNKRMMPLSVAGFLSLLGAVLYNNWLLALWLNPPAIAAGATTSELGAAGQPHYMLFRMLDTLAGVCFILGAAAIAAISRNPKVRLALTLLVIALGISTIVESLLMPLTCSSALSVQCADAELSGAVSWGHQLHILESVISYIFIALMPLITMLLAWRKKRMHGVRSASTVLTVYIALWSLESWFRELHHARNFGYEQWLFIVLFAIWYITVVKAAVPRLFKAERLALPLVKNQNTRSFRQLLSRTFWFL